MKLHVLNYEFFETIDLIGQRLHAGVIHADPSETLHFGEEFRMFGPLVKIILGEVNAAHERQHASLSHL